MVIAMKNRPLDDHGVYCISLGCAKNLVDTEHMLGLMQAGGCRLTETLDEAETVVINTCGFIQEAVEEAIGTILEAARAKALGTFRNLIVTGCFVQRYGYKLTREIPEVDAWVGTGEFHRIVDVLSALEAREGPLFLIGPPRYQADHGVPRIRTTPFFSTYLKISEGCSHRCSYCCIPRLRGPLRSRSLDSLVLEAERMVADGVKEINLVGQDITAYGRDRLECGGLERLLRRLVKVDGLVWIRLMYCNPEGMTDTLLELIEGEEKICPYLDIPLQHVSPAVLRAMGRGGAGESPWELIGRIRSVKRSIAIRTTFMVGFPGETEQDFENLLRFVKETSFDHLGVFSFSPESGTRAARIRTGIVPKKIAVERRRKVMQLQSRMAKKAKEGLIGSVFPVLIEGYCPETELLLSGRTSMMAPEVDGQVLITKGTGAEGVILPVRITEAHPYDLVGEIVS